MQQNFFLIKKKISRKFYWMFFLASCDFFGVIDKVLDSGLVVTEFELQSRSYV